MSKFFEQIEKLKDFKQIDFNDLRQSLLLSRKDKKYILHKDLLPKVIDNIDSTYRLVSVQDEYIQNYKTDYYDTSDFQMYLMHHNGIRNRYKIRKRMYELTQAVFLEFKKKDNKSVTTKTRVVTFMNQEWNEDQFNQLGQDFISFDKLEQKLQTSYKRITLTSEHNRITIDTDLSFSGNDSSKTLDNLVIIEFKYLKNQAYRKFSRLMLNLGLRPIRISKYCLGISYLYKIKANNFKLRLRKIEKIETT